MAGDSLTPTQRILWKRFDQHGELTFMTDDELREWAIACDKLVAEAGESPRMAPARTLWHDRLNDALAALTERDALGSDSDDSR
jgi:hypothetical protein